MVEEQEALEEVRDEAVAAQEVASRMKQASRQRPTELVARERLDRAREEAIRQREKSVESTRADLARRSDELECGCAEVHRREEEVTIRETDVKITATAQDAREEQAAKWEAKLAARKWTLAALAEQVKRGQAEAPATSGVPTSAAEGISLQEWLQIARDELETIVAERANVKLMMQNILRQARRSVRVVGLGRVNVGEKGMDQETIGHLTLGFKEISQCLKALPQAVQELASQEGRALAQAMAEHVLACYRS